MARTNKTHYVMLGMLSSFGELSGYDIKKLLETTSDWYWSESNAQIYPMLKRLEASGSVTSRIALHGARESRLYKITEEGSVSLSSWIGVPVEYRPMRVELLIKLRFAHLNEPIVMLEHMREFKRIIESKMSNMRHVMSRVNELHVGSCDLERDYVAMTYEYENELLNSKRSWCDKVIKKIEQHVSESDAS